jgi:photosystem II stability/assembly factor-like uncharacterized protein
MSRRLVRALLFVSIAFAALLTTTATAGAASLWTPVTSGTGQTITAIAIPKAAELIYVTSAGQIAYLGAGTTFTMATLDTANPLGFTDVAMSPDGTQGVAVGAHGAIYHSTNSGVSWTHVTASELTGSCPTPGAATGPLVDNLFSAGYGDATTVYVTGNNDDVLKSTDGGATFNEVNKSAAACVADPGGSGQGFGDSAWLSGGAGFLISNDFGSYFSTTNGFGAGTAKLGDSVNGFQSVDRFALDTSDPSRAWAIGGGGNNASYFKYTTNGGTTWTSPMYDGSQHQFTDIAASGKTVVAVGLGGDIYTSADGVSFYRQIAAAPNNTMDWQAVALVPGTNAAFVGGANGLLLETTNASQIPDTTAPTGTISGPTTLGPGVFGKYTATVTDNPGGSGVDPASLSWTVDAQTATGPTASFAFATTGVHTITLAFKDLAGNQGSATLAVNVVSVPPSGTTPVSTTTGGATVGIYKQVTVTGRNARYIPVNLSAKKARKFVIKLVGAHNKTLASLTVPSLVGKATVRLPIGAKVTSGTYKLVVRVYKTGKHGKSVGKQVKQVFVLS